MTVPATHPGSRPCPWGLSLKLSHLSLCNLPSGPCLSHCTIKSVTKADSDPWSPSNTPIFPSPLQMPLTQSLSATPTLLSAARLAHCRGPVVPLWMILGRLPIALGGKTKSRTQTCIPYPFCPISSGIFGSCLTLIGPGYFRHPGLHYDLVPCSPSVRMLQAPRPSHGLPLWPFSLSSSSSS